jgi:hypothetical protein
MSDHWGVRARGAKRSVNYVIDWMRDLRAIPFGQLPITFDHFFIFVSVLTTFAPELSESNGQN